MTDLFYLGAPIWLHPNWPVHLIGGLADYSQHFSAVEGNATFYALPSADTVRSWRDNTPEHFRFCFKIPKSITHDKLLINAQPELTEFLKRIEPLENRIGPIMVQLPPAFGPVHSAQLEQFVCSLPNDYQFAFEFRHPGFVDRSEHERQLNRLLRDHGCDRITFDTRPLFADEEQQMVGLNETEKEFYRIELGRKPNIEVRPFGLSSQPIVRIISGPNIEQSRPALQQWQNKISQWVEEGKRPYLFCHAPNEQYIPNFIELAQEIFGMEKYQSPQLGLI